MRFALHTVDGTSVTIDGHEIASTPGDADLTVDLGDGHLRAGLINAHDHLQFNHFSRLGSPPYPNTYEWARDLRTNATEEIERALTLPETDALLFGALKNLLGGVTTAVHHDPWNEIFDHRFPVRVPRLRVAHSLQLERDLEAAMAGHECTQHRPLSIHLAEGTDDVAAREVGDAATRGLLTQHLIAVHVVGIDAQDIELLRKARVAVVWCPSSNEFLYGRTAPAALFDSGIDILLGTDSLLTGVGTMLDELRKARRIGHLDDDRLSLAVGNGAAHRLGIAAPSLEPGCPADAILLRRPLFEARSRDVGLVLVGGKPMFGDAELANLFEICGVSTELMVVGGVRKLVVAPLATIAEKVIGMSPECGRILE